MKTVLQLVTYDISDPKSGGALRAYHIAESLRKNFFVYTMVFDLKDLPVGETWKDDPDFDRRFGSRIIIDLSSCMSRIDSLGEKGCLMDWGISNYVVSEKNLNQALCRMTRNLDPDILLLEQPFLWPIVDLLKKESVLKEDHQLVYSSHNIETALKKEIYAKAFDQSTARRHLSIVESLEKDSINAANLVITASREESSQIYELAPDKKITFRPNGHTYQPDPNNTWWQQHFERKGSTLNWIYVSSAHPPNVEGLRRLINTIPKSQENFKIWLLGSIGKTIDRDQYTFVECHPEISNQDIDDAIYHSTGVILPIWHGGGTNLKTAQALLSGKPIVSTEFAFRGFESHSDAPGVFLAKSTKEMLDILSVGGKQAHYHRKGLDGVDLVRIMSSLPADLIGLHS